MQWDPPWICRVCRAPPPGAVELWHRRYLRCLEGLFEEHKGRYGVAPPRHLEFV